MRKQTLAGGALLLLCLVMVGGCASRRCGSAVNYQDSGSTAEIVVPEGQTPPDTRSSLRVPPPGYTAQPRADDAPCLDAPPRYFDESGAIVGSPEALVYAWAEAFGRKDFELWSGLYSDYFSPPGGDMLAWRNERMQQMQQLGDARVIVEGLSMAPAPGGRMVARFIQRIQLGNNQTDTRKELVLVRDKNTWSIISDTDLGQD